MLVFSHRSSPSHNTINTKQVFELRRNGRLDEAFEIIKEALDNRSLLEDEWILKAAVYVLTSLIERAKSSGEKDLAFYKDLLSSIPLPDDDEIIKRTVNKALRNPVIERAKQLSQSGQADEAKKLYLQAIDQGIDVDNAKESLGWIYFKIANEEYHNQNYAQAKKEIINYMEMGFKKPSKLHSMILFLAYELYKSQKVPFNFFNFLHLWDLNNLTADDWQSHQGNEGVVFEPLSKRVISAAAMDVSKLKKEKLTPEIINAIESFLPWLDKLPRSAKEPWADQWKAKLLILLGRNEEALEYLKNVLKSKNSEAWAWANIARVYLDISDRDLALSCFAKAALCGGDEELKGSLRVTLAKLLVEKGNFEQAKAQLDTYLNFKKSMNEKISRDAEDMCMLEWYQTAESIAVDRQQLERYAEDASALVFDDVPYYNAMAGAEYTVKYEDPSGKEKVKRRVNIYFKDEESNVIVIKTSPASLSEKLSPGQPVLIQAAKDNNGDYSLISLNKRELGKYFDLAENRLCVVESIDRKAHKIYLLSSWDQSFSINERDCSIKDLKPGQVLSVKSISLKTNGRSFTEVFSAKVSEDKAPDNLLVEFTGTLKKSSDSFGFVRADEGEDIFVPGGLLNRIEFAESNSVKVKGLAVYSKNRKTGRKGLKALRISKA